MRKEEFEVKNAKERVCGEYIYLYPPGIPILVPGEIITEDIICYINKVKSLGFEIKRNSQNLNNVINVIKS